MSSIFTINFDIPTFPGDSLTDTYFFRTTVRLQRNSLVRVVTGVTLKRYLGRFYMNDCEFKMKITKTKLKIDTTRIHRDKNFGGLLRSPVDFNS